MFLKKSHHWINFIGNPTIGLRLLDIELLDHVFKEIQPLDHVYRKSKHSIKFIGKSNHCINIIGNPVIWIMFPKKSNRMDHVYLKSVIVS